MQLRNPVSVLTRIVLLFQVFASEKVVFGRVPDARRDADLETHAQSKLKVDLAQLIDHRQVI